MDIWLLLEVVTLAIGAPVLALEYYWVILLATSMKYPRSLANEKPRLGRYPLVTVLIATFNEKFVIQRALEAIKQLD